MFKQHTVEQVKHNSNTTSTALGGAAIELLGHFYSCTRFHSKCPELLEGRHAPLPLVPQRFWSYEARHTLLSQWIEDRIIRLARKRSTFLQAQNRWKLFVVCQPARVGRQPRPFQGSEDDKRAQWHRDTVYCCLMVESRTVMGWPQGANEWGQWPVVSLGKRGKVAACTTGSRGGTAHCQSMWGVADSLELI